MLTTSTMEADRGQIRLGYIKELVNKKFYREEVKKNSQPKVPDARRGSPSNGRRRAEKQLALMGY